MVLGPLPNAYSHGGDADPSIHEAIDLSGDFNQLQNFLLSRDRCETPPTGRDVMGLGPSICELAREPAPTASGLAPSPAVIASRRDDLSTFCSNSRVAQIAERFRSGEGLDRALSRAAQREFAEAEAESILDVIDEPYFSMARGSFYFASGPDYLESAEESGCRGLDPLLPSSDTSTSRDPPELSQAIRDRCSDFANSAASICVSESCHSAGTSSAVMASGDCWGMKGLSAAAIDRCLERVRAEFAELQERIREENRAERARCLEREARQVAVCRARLEASSEALSDAYESCVRGVRAEFTARTEESRRRESEARARRTEEDYVRCRERYVLERRRSICSLTAEPGTSDSFLADALSRSSSCSTLPPVSSAPLSDSNSRGPSRTDLRVVAKSLRDEVNGMRNAYDHIFPEPKMESCLSRMGPNARGVCESLERARQRGQAQLSEIYSPERLAQANERLNQLKENFRGFINSQRGLSVESRAMLLRRLDNVVIGAPAGAEALAGVIRGGATYNCGFNERPPFSGSSTAPRECSTSYINLPPDMLMRFLDGNDLDSGPVESILFHEMGHAVTLPGPDSLFENLSRCLNRSVNVSGFDYSARGIVSREALADWFGAQAMGAQLRAAPASIRTGMVENRLGSWICGAPRSKADTCIDQASAYFYPTDIIENTVLEPACRLILKEYGHPLTPDRLNVLLSNGGVKSALGCSAASLSETRGCSL